MESLQSELWKFVSVLREILELRFKLCSFSSFRTFSIFLKDIGFPFELVCFLSFRTRSVISGFFSLSCFFIHFSHQFLMRLHQLGLPNFSQTSSRKEKSVFWGLKLSPSDVDGSCEV